MNPEPIITESADETLAIGRALAGRLAAPVLVLLKGDLGVGKTTLVKGIISGLGAAREEDVTSPTFTLVHVFQTPNGAAADQKQSPKVYHVDLYRVEGQHELESLALEDVLGSLEPGIVVVEWSERLTIRSDWPLVRVELEHLGDDKRSIHIHRAEDSAPKESSPEDSPA